MFRLTVIVILTAYLHLSAQPMIFLNGYTESLHGETITYRGPDPRAETALLIRSLDSTQSIQWKTNPLPAGFRDATASLVWLFGMDASPDRQVFTLSVNGVDLLNFNNPGKAEMKEIEYKGQYGSRLEFRTTLIDQNKDVMGYAILTLPANLISTGAPVLLQVRGRTAGSQIWYMTFQYPVQERISIQPQDLLIKRDGKQFQAILAEIVNLDTKKEITIYSEGQPAEIFSIESGYNSFQYFIPEVNNRVEIPVHIKTGEGQDLIETCSVAPVRPWTIYLVQHTHTDIGYTRPQSEILPEHLRFIDFALDFCDQTDDYPDDSKFRWTCESAWAVDEYLLRRPEAQVARLLNRIREGRIEVTGMLFNMSEIADETALKNSLTPIQRFHDKGIRVKTAMQDDVNGIGWCLADYLPDIGVNYLIMGEHGHRARIPFDLPTSFWWASPSGKKILAYRGEHYMYGNFLLLHVGNLDNFRSNLLDYLDDLSGKRYPFNQISLQYSGYVTDNSPPAITPNKVIKEWNELYIWPRLRSATASEFMHKIETEHGAELELIQKAWPDWWTDGFGSAARETAAARETQTGMNITTGLLSMAAAFGTGMEDQVQQRIERIYNQVLFYDEHTFGAAESISKPYSENSMNQWAEKSSYVWEALKESRILREESFGMLQEHVPRYDVPSISVFNTLNWSRSGPVQVYIDHEILEPGQAFSIQDERGKSIPAQALSSRSDGTNWILWVENIPPMGFKSLRIEKSEGQTFRTDKRSFAGIFENKYWTANIDPEVAAISSLVYKDWKQELVDLAAIWKPSQLIYERLSNRHQLELFTLEEEPKRTSLTGISFDYLEEGPLWTTISIHGTLKDCALDQVAVEYRFYNEEPLIEVVYKMNKKPVTDPEALYVAFPFELTNAEIFFDVQGGIVRPGKDQIAGTASDWNTVQNFVALRSEKRQLLVSCPEIPLFQLGGLNLGNFSKDHQLSSSHFYSWVLNNYWTTNFKAYQEGEFTWRYFITVSDEPDLTTATRIGWNNMNPLIGRVLPPGASSGAPRSGSIITEALPGLLFVNVMPNRSGNGIVYQIREISGNTYQLDPGKLIKFKEQVECHEVNVLGEKISSGSDKITFKPNSVHFIEIRWNQQ